MAGLAHVVERRPRTVALAAGLLALASLGFALRFAADPLEYDFGKLRDSRALHRGGPAFWEDAVFGSHHDPCVVLARDEHEARAAAAAFESRRGGDSTIGRVASIASFVPAQQEAKLPVIAEIRRLVVELLPELPGEVRAQIEPLLPPADLRPFTSSELPAMVRGRLTEKDGTVGTPVLVYPTDAVSVWNGRDALRVAADLRAVPLPRDDLPMASSLLVFADVLHAIATDGPRATLVSFVGVALLVLVLLRRRAPEVLFALALGVLYFAGVAGALGLKLNMLSFIALPLTFGIGVDYATNIVQRRRLSGASYPECLRTTGAAVVLCSLTTIIGYSSLLVAHNQALRSFGLLANLGELACLAAALIVLPSLHGTRRARSAAADASLVE
jgi:predicted RND superfamily exporter protein